LISTTRRIFVVVGVTAVIGSEAQFVGRSFSMPTPRHAKMAREEAPVQAACDR
jgi:hypothetical protein